jgi:hypothetical protein
MLAPSPQSRPWLWSILRIGLGPVLALAVSDSALAQQPPAQIAVSPPRIELELAGRPVREHFRLSNLGNEPVDVQVSVANWDLDEQNQVRLLPPTEQSLDQWMIMNPTRFTVMPGESQVVRIGIRPRVRPAPGEHRAMVYFTQQPSGEHVDDRLHILFRFGAAVYAYVGNVTRRGTLLGVSQDSDDRSPRFLFDVESQGDAHVRLNGQYVVWPESVYPGRPGTLILDGPGGTSTRLPPSAAAAGRLPTTPVLPGSRRNLPLAIAPALPAGAYVLDVKGQLGEKDLARAVPFTVSAGH